MDKKNSVEKEQCKSADFCGQKKKLMIDIDKVLTRLGITDLNEMQQKTTAAILGTDNDVVVLSPTGSGKTLAYLLPVAHEIDTESDDVQVVVIVPGRELALQSDTVLRDMSCGVRSVSCYGGRPAMDEHKVIRKVQPHVVFGTPGRLNDHLDKRNINPYNIRCVVIDEFDKCLQMGFHDEMSRLLKKLPGLRRRILLSATDADEIPSFVHLNEAVRIDCLDAREQVPHRVTIHEVRSEIKDKLAALSLLLRSFEGGSAVVFLNYRDSVERTADHLRREGFAVSHFHGGMPQEEREAALYRFSNGSSNVFVCTDLASRGLDIPDIDNIVHYHLPQGEDGYVHRVGRTARWESTGRTFFVLGPEEHIPDFVEGDVSVYALPSPDLLPPPAPAKMLTLYIGKGKKDKLSKGDIVGFLCKKGGLTSADIGRIDVKERYCYVAVLADKASRVLANTAGEKIKGVKTVVEIVK